jgi:Flp pilus assembly pilin Flp
MHAHRSIPDLEFVRSEQGQTMSEYGVVLGVITIGVVVAIGLLSTAVQGNIGDVASAIVDSIPA